MNSRIAARPNRQTIEAIVGTVPSCRVIAYQVVPQIIAQTTTPAIPSRVVRDRRGRATGRDSVGEDMSSQ
ncbi:hypothetical protein GCM10009422_23730 [Brevundimonas kwangchunensis]|uniref:Uncharacterized protein n=1 Tax=Brevundimonas kwangchunensis TaxID=322163 RepID=A0ABP3S845_9CAUL